MMSFVSCKKDPVQPEHIVYREQEQDANIKGVPEAEDVQREALFTDTYLFANRQSLCSSRFSTILWHVSKPSEGTISILGSPHLQSHPA